MTQATRDLIAACKPFVEMAKNGGCIHNYHWQTLAGAVAALEAEMAAPDAVTMEVATNNASLLRSNVEMLKLSQRDGDTIAALQAENARLRSALEPFATEAQFFTHSAHSDDYPYTGDDLKLGDLRRARAALEGRTMTNALTQINWTAREALACAYCWAEFCHPENRDKTPEAYWLKITERTRNECRMVANRLMLLAVARGEWVAMPPSPDFGDDARKSFLSALNLKSESRLWRIYTGVFRVLKARAS